MYMESSCPNYFRHEISTRYTNADIYRCPVLCLIFKVAKFGNTKDKTSSKRLFHQYVCLPKGLSGNKTKIVRIAI